MHTTTWQAPILGGLVAASVLAGCASLPDGSRIQRLPEAPAGALAALSPDESRRLTELNARLLADQEQARAREEALAAQRARDAQMYLDLHYGWGPGWHRDWLWNGSRWVWRPRWGVGLGWYGP